MDQKKDDRPREDIQVLLDVAIEMSDRQAERLEEAKRHGNDAVRAFYLDNSERMTTSQIMELLESWMYITA